MRSAPTLDPRKRHPFSASNDDIPTAINKPGGCPFHTRCQLVSAQCRVEEPELTPRGADRLVACHHR